MKILDDYFNKKIIEAIFDFTPTNKLPESIGITNKSIKKRLKKLYKKGFIFQSNDFSKYYIKPKTLLDKKYNLKDLSESAVFDNDINTLNLHLNSNSEFIMFYGFTEMLNNAIDHSKGKLVSVVVYDVYCGYLIFIDDDGIGIFKKIKKVFRLKNESESVLHLSKGKLTTDKENHSGQGIFFTSRLMDHFAIWSGDNYFTHDWDKPKDVLSLANPEQSGNNKGTTVMMSLRKESKVDSNDVFNEFSSKDGNYAFQKTIVPVMLVKYATKEMLVSRSQAKMVISGLEDFAEIIFNFDGVVKVGQGFADEIFRVFKNKNPDKSITWINANKDVLSFINKAISDSTK